MHEECGRELAEAGAMDNGDVPKSLACMRKAHFERVLRLADNDITKAAELLDISPRELRRWLNKLGMT